MAAFYLVFICYMTSMIRSRKETHLNQGHLRAEGQQDFLRLGGVGVVSVLVEPLLERPRHILQGLALVSHFTTAGTTTLEEQVEKKFSQIPHLMRYMYI